MTLHFFANNAGRIIYRFDVAVSKNNSRLFTHLHSRIARVSRIVYIFYLYPLILLRLSQRLNFSLESVRALRASIIHLSPFFSYSLRLCHGKKASVVVSHQDLMERSAKRKRNVRKAQKGGYLATKLSCLMLVADVAQSVLKELREERVWLKSTGKLGRHFACKETSSFVLVAPTYSCDLNVIRTRVGGEEARQFAVCGHFYARSSRDSKNASSFMPWKRIRRRRSLRTMLCWRDSSVSKKSDLVVGQTTVSRMRVLFYPRSSTIRYNRLR